MNFYYNIRIILGLPFEILISRLLKIIKLREYILSIIRKKYHINEHEIPSLRPNCFLDSNAAKIYPNENAYFDNGIVFFRIGSSEKKIDLTLNYFKSDEYIFEYLFYYLNWFENLESIEGVDILKKVLFEKNKIKDSPHPTSNRIMNYYFQAYKFEKIISHSEISRLLISDFNKLIFNTEEFTGGNHVIDNYLAIFLIGSIFGIKNIKEFAQRKLQRIVSQKKYFENNPSYLRLLLIKIELIKVKHDCELLVKLRKCIIDIIPFIQNSKLPIYNDVYFHAQYNFSNFDYPQKYVGDKFIFIPISTNSYFFFLMDGTSQPGSQGHDHDSSYSMEIVVDNNRIIRTKGTSEYSNSKNRNIERSRKSGAKLFPNEQYAFFNGIFRVLHISKKRLNIYDSFEILVIYECGKKSCQPFIRFNYISQKKSNCQVIFFNHRCFKFYSETAWQIVDGVLMNENVCIENVEAKVSNSLIYDSLYAPRNGFYIETKATKASVCINF